MLYRYESVVHLNEIPTSTIENPSDSPAKDAVYDYITIPGDASPTTTTALYDNLREPAAEERVEKLTSCVAYGSSPQKRVPNIV